MNLFVGNLSPETEDINLRDHFAPFGHVVSTKVIKDINTGVSRCFGFVEMKDINCGFDAIDNLDASFLLGSIISVKEAKQPNARPSSSTNSGNSYPKPNPVNRAPKPRIPIRPRRVNNDI